jgi:hypothetical protein
VEAETLTPLRASLRRRLDVRCEPLPDGSAVLYDPVAETAYAISESAALVWELCDGAHTATAIGGELAAVYDAPADVIARDVAALLDRLLELGLLERAGRGTVS